MPVMREESENQNQGSSAEQEAREQLREAQEAQRERIEEAKERIRARSRRKAEAEAKTYTVQPGDTLGKIAQSQLGDASRWQEIWEANKEAVPDPDQIEVGQELIIP